MSYIHFTEDELLALAAANAPNPTRELIDQFHKFDVEKNPYRDKDKPSVRTEIEIISDYKLDFAETLFKRMAARKRKAA